MKHHLKTIAGILILTIILFALVSSSFVLGKEGETVDSKKLTPEEQLVFNETKIIDNQLDQIEEETSLALTQSEFTKIKFEYIKIFETLFYLTKEEVQNVSLQQYIAQVKSRAKSLRSKLFEGIMTIAKEDIPERKQEEKSDPISNLAFVKRIQKIQDDLEEQGIKFEEKGATIGRSEVKVIYRKSKSSFTSDELKNFAGITGKFD